MLKNTPSQTDMAVGEKQPNRAQPALGVNNIDALNLGADALLGVAPHEALSAALQDDIGDNEEYSYSKTYSMLHDADQASTSSSLYFMKLGGGASATNDQ